MITSYTYDVRELLNHKLLETHIGRPKSSLTSYLTRNFEAGVSLEIAFDFFMSRLVFTGVTFFIKT